MKVMAIKAQVAKRAGLNGHGRDIIKGERVPDGII